jgi:hypothetical protein
MYGLILFLFSKVAVNVFSLRLLFLSKELLDSIFFSLYHVVFVFKTIFQEEFIDQVEFTVHENPCLVSIFKLLNLLCLLSKVVESTCASILELVSIVFLFFLEITKNTDQIIINNKTQAIIYLYLSSIFYLN